VSVRSLRRLSTRTRAAFKRHRRTIRYARLKEELFDEAPEELDGGGVRVPAGVMGVMPASVVASPRSVVGTG